VRFLNVYGGVRVLLAECSKR